MPPRYLLSTASLYFYSLGQTFYLAQEAGFAGLELSLSPATVRLPPERIRSMAREAGLVLASVHPPTIPLPGWGYSPEAFKRLASLARSFPDCRLVVLHVPDAHEEQDPLMQRFYRTIEVLQEELSGSLIEVALENRNRQPGEPLGPLDAPEDILAFSRHYGCRIVLDTAHASTMDFPLLKAYRILREQLINIHLSDVVPGGWWTRFSYPRSIFSHHRPPGQGTLPLAELMAEIGRDGYAGWITLELSPLALPLFNRPATINVFRQILQTCQTWLESGKPTGDTR